MKLYRITYDNEDNFVEAPSFELAILIWKEYARREWCGDNEEPDEPESVHLIHDGGVIRAVAV